MLSLTLAQIKTKIKNDLDLNGDDANIIVTDAELNDLVNEAIDEAEQVIMTINEDYFLKSAFIALVEGTDVYALPTDIYANKIRGLMYRDNTLWYPIKRLPNFRKFEHTSSIDAIQPVGNPPTYQYLIRYDDQPTGYQLEFFPSVQETSAQNVTMWYIRNANRLTLDADICDLPEANNYIFAHIKKGVLTKEFGGITPQSANNELDKQQGLLVSTLTEKTPDNYTNEITPNIDPYWEHN